MKLIGNKDLFGVELGKAALAYQLAVYVQGNDILQFKKEGVIYAYKWRNCQDIIEWIHENMKYILNDDEFPLLISADSAAEKCEICYNSDLDDIEKYDVLQDWMFRHSWFSARAGSYLADIYFVKKGNMIEISWNNINTFREDGISFIFPKGRYEVDKEVFEEIMKNVCELYDNL